MHLVVNLVVFAAFAYVVVDFVRSYKAASGTVWQRLLATGRHSATILWQRCTIALAGFADALVWLADLLQAPGVAEPIKSVLQPQYVAVFVVAVAVVGELARRRTLGPTTAAAAEADVSAVASTRADLSAVASSAKADG
jgi:hypothetical protein